MHKLTLNQVLNIVICLFSASCKGRCNDVAPSGCRCDPSCRKEGGCCHDFEAQCPNQYGESSEPLEVNDQK